MLDGNSSDVKSSTQLQLPRESLLGRQLIVENIPENVGWKDLKDFLRQSGNVVRVNIMPNSTISGFHAVVLFSTSKDAKKTLESLNGYVWQGKKLAIRLDKSLVEVLKPHTTLDIPIAATSQRTRSSSESLKGPESEDVSSKTQVFVCNLPYIVGWQDLKDLFREAGSVLRTDIKHDSKTGKSKGMGTVVFSSSKSARTAVELFDGFEWFGRRIEVRVDKSHESQHNASVIPRKLSANSNSTNDRESENDCLDFEDLDLSTARASWAEKVKVKHNLPSAPHNGNCDNQQNQFPASPYKPNRNSVCIPASKTFTSSSVNKQNDGSKPDFLGPGFHGICDTVGRMRSSSLTYQQSEPCSISSSLPSVNRNIWANQGQNDIASFNMTSSPLDMSSFGNRHFNQVPHRTYFQQTVQPRWRSSSFSHHQHHTATPDLFRPAASSNQQLK